MFSHKYRLYLHLQHYLFRGGYFVSLDTTNIVLVVEPFSVRDLAADCPIYILFKPSRLSLFQNYVVANIALRGFQQFNGFASAYYYAPGLSLIHYCPQATRQSLATGYDVELYLSNHFYTTRQTGEYTQSPTTYQRLTSC